MFAGKRSKYLLDFPPGRGGRRGCMQFRCFSIFDSKAKAFLPPFFMAETGLAVRAFRDCVIDPNHAFGRNPMDYSLFSIGGFDDSSGLLIAQSQIELVCNGPECLKRESDRTESHQRRMFTEGSDS